jgi:hypothetical protein
MPDYGRLDFQDAGTFRETPGNALDQALDELATYSRKGAQPPNDWPRITECLRHQTMISLTAENARVRTFLRFDPAQPEAGSYQLRIPSEHFAEEGRVLSVAAIDEANRYRRAYSMLSDFAHRYVITTQARNPQTTRRVWRVGISSLRQITDEYIK